MSSRSVVSLKRQRSQQEELLLGAQRRLTGTVARATRRLHNSCAYLIRIMTCYTVPCAYSDAASWKPEVFRINQVARLGNVWPTERRRVEQGEPAHLVAKAFQ